MSRARLSSAPEVRPCYVLGLDLGLRRDRSALAIVKTGPALKLVTWAQFPLGTPYRQIPDLIRRVLKRLPSGARVTLALDASGVGAAVLDLFRLAGLPLRVVPVTITAGAASRRTSHGHNISRSRLLGHALAQVVSGALECSRPSILRKRIEDALRLTSAPDDLVFALALALLIAVPDFPHPEQRHPSRRLQS